MLESPVELRVCTLKGSFVNSATKVLRRLKPPKPRTTRTPQAASSEQEPVLIQRAHDSGTEEQNFAQVGP